jgi:predicted glycosyltransferase
VRRILVYSHDTYGLGNIRRMLEISRYLVDRDPDVSVLILSGSPMLHAFRIPARIDYLKLPCLSRTRDGGYAVKYLDLDFDAVVRMRSNLILNAFLDFDPDLLLVDKKPLGVGDELRPTLELASRRGRRTKVALVLRDILDAPEVTTEIWRRNGYHDAIADHYDRVLVLGSPCVFDVVREYDFPDPTAGMVRYCGYVGRRPSPRFAEQVRAELGVGDGQQLVLLTVGGGDDGDRLLTCYLDGWRSAPDLREAGVTTLVLSGPEMPESDRRRFIDHGGDPRLLVRDFSDDVMGCMAAADLVVSMGGYNTVCELLTLHKQAVVVPRVRPVREQWVRAERMDAMGLFRAIHPDRLQPSLLMAEVRAGLARSRAGEVPPIAAVDMHGLTRVYESVADLGSPAPAWSPPAIPALVAP